MPAIPAGPTTATQPGGNTRLNALLIRSIIVGALGGLLFGFDTAVIAGTTQQLTQVFDLTAKELGFTVSIALLGTIIGAMCSGILGDKLGGRESLRILAGFYIISALGCALPGTGHRCSSSASSEDLASAALRSWDRCTSPRSLLRAGEGCWSARSRSTS